MHFCRHNYLAFSSRGAGTSFPSLEPWPQGPRPWWQNSPNAVAWNYVLSLRSVYEQFASYSSRRADTCNSFTCGLVFPTVGIRVKRFAPDPSPADTQVAPTAVEVTVVGPFCAQEVIFLRKPDISARGHSLIDLIPANETL